MRENFVSEETKQYFIEHQEALTRQFKVEAAAIKYWNAKHAEDRRKAQALQTAIDTYKRLLRSPNAKDKLKGLAAKDVCDDLSAGRRPSASKVRLVEELFD